MYTASIDDGLVVRLDRLVIDNIKGVGHGEVSFTNPRRPHGPRIVGLYGQNGSGKSTLIDILEVVRECLAGEAVDARFANIVDVDAGYGHVTSEFSIEVGESDNPDDQKHIRAVYSVCLREERAYEGGTEPGDSTIRIFDEELAVSVDKDEELGRMTTVVNTTGSDPFGPKSKLKRLVGSAEVLIHNPYLRSARQSRNQMRGITGEALEIDLAEARHKAYQGSRSFVFSDDLRDAIVDHRSSARLRSAQDDKLATVVTMVLSCLPFFARNKMFVLSSSDAGKAIAGLLRLPARNNVQRLSPSYSFTKSLELLFKVDTSFDINRPSWVNPIVLENVTGMIETMNKVLGQIVPGLYLTIDTLGEELPQSKEKSLESDNWVQRNKKKYLEQVKLVQVHSHRGGRCIPFSSESGGIKRIVSFVNYLVLMYNDPCTFVAIDEIDSGVFEYLLGELLAIVSEGGLGQLVFTSHNLRPLETIDRGYICFTTTNPMNRYIRMANVKTNNNLRDFYYRDIVLGGQREQLYEPTNNGEIELALMEAVMLDGE